MRKAFAAAVAKQNRAAMAVMTDFPLAVENYGSKPTLSKSAFLGSKDYFSGWFFDGGKDIVDCIGKSALQFQADKKQFGAGGWYADCNGNEYYFSQHGAKWLFSGYQNINE